jgi:hypothetical protein
VNRLVIYSIFINIQYTVYLEKYFIKLPRGGDDCPVVLGEMGFWIPPHPHLHAHASRTRAISLLNDLAEHVDLFHAGYFEMIDFIWHMGTNER